MYIGGQKVGYTHISSDRVKFEGVERTRMQSYVKTKMTVLGTAVQQPSSLQPHGADPLVTDFFIAPISCR